MILETKCPACDGPMLLEADESAGQEIIDKLALCVRCFRCQRSPTLPTRDAPVKTPHTRTAQPRKPYAD